MIKISADISGDFDWINPAATLIAVLLGALLSYFATNYLERRKLLEQREFQAHRLAFRLQEVADDLLKLSRHIKKSLGRFSISDDDPNSWQALEELLGFSSHEVRFDIDDISMLIRYKEDKLATSLLEIESAHRSCLLVFHEICRSKNSLAAISKPDPDHPGIFSVEFDPAVHPEAYLNVIKMQSLAPELISDLKGINGQIREAFGNLVKFFDEKLKFQGRLKISIPEE